ncbi:hypothetical protein SynBIOSE41_03678 [Synechococcus sp. BIOS-E4-1]|nr:hypothetical protein SynBIOSE41_03678 [Synechococcus sp. BIOS-E4-1]
MVCQRSCCFGRESLTATGSKGEQPGRIVHPGHIHKKFIGQSLTGSVAGIFTYLQ